MASNINPSNINGAYPIAGQDNDSQGFRDNFTNIRSNLTFAQAEITALQTSTVTIGAENDLATTTLKNPKMWGATEKVYHHGAVSGTSVVVDFSAGDYQDMDVSGNITFSFSNWPASGTYAKLRVLFVNVAANETITFPSEVVYGIGQVAGFSGQAFTPAVAGDYLFEFSTDVAGATVAVKLLNSPAGYKEPAEVAIAANVTTLQGNITTLNSKVYTGSEALANAGAANVALTCSHITTNTIETATLAAGTDGLIKVFALKANGSNVANTMTVTVTNAAWGGSGTILLNAVGQACTLQYISSKWFCVGNNGCTFA